MKLVHKKGEANDPRNFRMIALTGCIGKSFNLILSDRLTTFLVKNKFIDETLQKVFLPGINGCIEHNVAMDEIVRDTKSRNKTVLS